MGSSDYIFCENRTNVRIQSIRALKVSIRARNILKLLEVVIFSIRQIRKKLVLGLYWQKRLGLMRGKG